MSKPNFGKFSHEIAANRSTQYQYGKSNSGLNEDGKMVIATDIAETCNDCGNHYVKECPVCK